VDVDVRAHLDFLDLDDLLLLPGLGGLLLALVLEAAEIEDLADRRDRIRRNLDEIETGLCGDLERPLDRYGSVIVALVVDQLNFIDADFLIDPRPVLGGWGGPERFANGVVSFVVSSVVSGWCRAWPATAAKESVKAWGKSTEGMDFPPPGRRYRQNGTYLRPPVFDGYARAAEHHGRRRRLGP
jgi:hypothetical protein